MPLDIYHRMHKHDYNRIFNFYENDKDEDIENELNNYLDKLKNNTIIVQYQKIDQVEENISLVHEVKKLIKTLKNVLSVVDDRFITNIGGRVIYYARPRRNKSY